MTSMSIFSSRPSNHFLLRVCPPPPSTGQGLKGLRNDLGYVGIQIGVGSNVFVVEGHRVKGLIWSLGVTSLLVRLFIKAHEMEARKDCRYMY
jgi:hypothetical protein